MKLYELPERYEAIYNQLVDGELTPDLERELDQLDATLTAKCDNICGLIQQLTREAEAADAEADRLKRLAQVRHNAATSLKAYLQGVMDRIGKDRIETDIFRVRIQKNSQPSVQWAGTTDALPPFMRRTIVELDKRVALDWWREGKPLPDGMKIVQGYHLRVQ